MGERIQTVTVTGGEAQALSGIASVACEIDGGGWTITQGATAKVEITTDGQHTLSCYSVTGAGVQGPAANETIHVDSTPPTVAFSEGPSQSSWSTTAQSIRVTATKPANSSGVAQISCTLGGQATVYTNTGNPDSESATVTVQPPGGELTCRALDNAGNASTTAAWNFLIDNTPPTGEFLPTKALDPSQVQVRVQDTGSGVAGAEIEIQTSTGWRRLPTDRSMRARGSRARRSPTTARSRTAPTTSRRSSGTSRATRRRSRRTRRRCPSL